MVDWSALKRALEIVYSATLPKASKPFIYMSIVVPLEHVDVNVHPTKREVSLLSVCNCCFVGDLLFYILDVVVTRSQNLFMMKRSFYPFEGMRIRSYSSKIRKCNFRWPLISDFKWFLISEALVNIREMKWDWCPFHPFPISVK